ncbi:MAG TPA: cytochrome c1 [Burkholderiales bacterium]|nr:cytochrome c1 [Burkholderiales bacterium]
MSKLLALLLLAPLAAAADEGGRLDRAPIDPHDVVSLQSGARTFVNYCLNCHSASSMRYNRLEDIGLTELQIKDNLMFAADKVGETMAVAMRPKDAKGWFGVAPPDLTVIARARGADWLYTYLRTFYRDPSRPTGWNNVAFPNVGMPHVLYQLQGVQVLKVEQAKNAHGEVEETRSLVLEQPGALSRADYDALVRDLVNYLAYMGEPARNQRVRIGIFTVLFLGLLLLPFAWLMKRAYWKDVH